ncbi:hypothetical protein Ancab_013162 [Ancistrocladus abbreviatus]
MATHHLRLSGDRNKALQQSYAGVVKKHSSLPTSSIDHRAYFKTSYLEVIVVSHTAYISGKPCTLSILEENFGRNWESYAPQTYNTPVEIQSSKEKEFTPLVKPTTKARSSFSHVSTSSNAEVAGNKDCNDDANIKVRENLKLGTDSLDQTRWSGDFVCAFNETFPDVEISAGEETQSSQDGDTINVVEGSQNEAYHRETEDTV